MTSNDFFRYVYAEIGNVIKPTLKDREYFDRNKDSYLSIRDLHQLTDESIAIALLERAWQESFYSCDTKKKHIEKLFKCADDGCPVILFGNTNKSTVLAFLQFLKKEYPSRFESLDPNEHTLSCAARFQDGFSSGMICLSAEICLCPSYTFGALKMTSDMSKLSFHFPDLNKFKESLLLQLHRFISTEYPHLLLKFVSEDEKSRTEFFGFKDGQIYRPDNFFRDSTAGEFDGEYSCRSLF